MVEAFSLAPFTNKSTFADFNSYSEKSILFLEIAVRLA